MNDSTEDRDRIHVRVLFFGAARDAAGTGNMEIAIPPPATVRSAFEYLTAKFPSLERFGRSLLFAVNQEYANKDQLINENDELAIFPPVSGGSNETTNAQDFFQITTKPLDVGAIARKVVLPQCGATVTLDGYAREWTAGRRTLYLVYEAYEGMALAELEKLGSKAHERFDIAHIGIVHRTGRLEIGETSVVIAVSAPHRRAAFEACEWAIRELKRRVPIWKKEVFADGEEWVQTQEES